MVEHSLKDRPITDYPFYWFALLQQAVERGKDGEAAAARLQLRALGYRVSYTPSPAARREGAGNER